MDSYHDYIKHALAKQRTLHRDAEFQQPTWQQTVETLSGGKPANIEDLYTLTIQHLRDLQPGIKQSNTDKYKMFWKTGNYSKIEKPATEDICRDRLIDLLHPVLSPTGLRAEPEGHMASDKRADIVIFSSPGQKLPLELKLDCHAELWTACANQLDRLYTRDPEALGYGIYVVFWFGDKRGKKIPPPPKGLSQPKTPKELENELLTLIPANNRSRLQVVVIDVTPP